MMYTERAETAAVSRGTSQVTTKQRCKYTTSVDDSLKNFGAIEKQVTHSELHATKTDAVGVLESGESVALYKSDQHHISTGEPVWPSAVVRH